MRIVAGTAKGTKLSSVEGENTRPTLDRVKENFFNAIKFELDGKRVLDLFAGSGQLGLEALSRGAREAVFVDFDVGCADMIRKNAQKAKLYSQCNVYHSDYLEYLSVLRKRKNFDESTKFDIVFLDPPYEEKAATMVKDVVKRLIKHKYIAQNALIICEANSEINFDADSMRYFSQLKVYKYGKVYVTVIKIDMREDSADIDSTETGDKDE